MQLDQLSHEELRGLISSLQANNAALKATVEVFQQQADGFVVQRAVMQAELDRLQASRPDSKPPFAF